MGGMTDLVFGLLEQIADEYDRLRARLAETDTPAGVSADTSPISRPQGPGVAETDTPAG